MSSSFDDIGEYGLVCSACNKHFSRANTYESHHRTCTANNKRLQVGQSTLKHLQSLKRQKLDLGSLSRLLNTSQSQSNLHSNTTVQDASSAPNGEDSQMAASTPSDAPRRSRRANAGARYRDMLPFWVPEAARRLKGYTTSVAQSNSDFPSAIDNHQNPSAETTTSPTSTANTTLSWWNTSPNQFGLVKHFYGPRTAPAHNPDEYRTLAQLCDDPALSECEGPDDSDSRHETEPQGAGTGHPSEKTVTGQDATQTQNSTLYPYPNQSSMLLHKWYWSSTTKSQKDFKRLIAILSSPGFRQEEVVGLDWKALNKKLVDGEDYPVATNVGQWKQEPVTFDIPFHRQFSEAPSCSFQGGTLHHRTIVSIMKEKLAVKSDLHLDPFELWWIPRATESEPWPSGVVDQRILPPEAIRVHGELYWSEAVMAAHKELQDSPREAGCNLDRVLMPLMAYSDATQLTHFGTAQLWPGYLYFGGDSKYERIRPSRSLAEHLAYFVKLPDEFQDFVLEQAGKEATNALETHCSRVLYHAQWCIILDDEFLEAHEHGVVILCWDGKPRRFYPRIFTYSADYPEKVLLANVRNMGSHPCPRCLVLKVDIPDVGTRKDMFTRNHKVRNEQEAESKLSRAHDIIYSKRFAVTSKHVEELLKDQSLASNENAFLKRMSSCKSFKLYDMLVVDFMHEIELGVWKSIFIHLLRILHCYSDATVELNRRQMPIFGKDTIRRFKSNVSELKHMTANKYEDLLQCAIPAFEGLVPEPANSNIMDLLYTLAHWHGMIGAGMQTTKSLELNQSLSTLLSNEIRNFKKEVCTQYDTKELPREQSARLRRQKETSSQIKSGKLPKSFNMETYKIHAIMDYVPTIQRLGSVDSYSTAMGESEHRRSKQRFSRTNYKNYEKQLAEADTRLRRLNRMSNADYVEDEDGHSTRLRLDVHHCISLSRNDPLHLVQFIQDNLDKYPIMMQSFIPNLKKHLLTHIQRLLLEEIRVRRSDATSAEQPLLGLAQFSSVDVAGVTFKAEHLAFHREKIYRHNTLHINYTTYDLRRSQDLINPDTVRCNVMVLKDEMDEEYTALDLGEGNMPWCRPRFRYARVLGVYHANVVYSGPGSFDADPRPLEFLWVHWYDEIPGPTPQRRLQRLRFAPSDSPQSFGFVDPSEVIRGAHIVPAFAQGSISAQESMVWPWKCKDNFLLYKEYYVNCFADSDMLVRHHWGLGIGHVHTMNCLLAAEKEFSLDALVAQDAPWTNPTSENSLNHAGTSSSDLNVTMEEEDSGHEQYVLEPEAYEDTDFIDDTDSSDSSDDEF